MSQADYRPRLSTELTYTSYKKLSEILPFGWQKPLFQALVNGVISLYDKGGTPAIGAVVSNHIEVESLLNAGLQQTKVEAIRELSIHINNLGA